MGDGTVTIDSKLTLNNIKAISSCLIKEFVVVHFCLLTTSLAGQKNFSGKVQKLAKQKYHDIYRETGKVKIFGKDWVLEDTKILNNYYKDFNQLKIVLVRGLKNFKYEGEECFVSLRKKGKRNLEKTLLCFISMISKSRGRNFFEYKHEMEEVFLKKKNIRPELLLASDQIDTQIDMNSDDAITTAVSSPYKSLSVTVIVSRSDTTLFKLTLAIDIVTRLSYSAHYKTVRPPRTTTVLTWVALDSGGSEISLAKLEAVTESRCQRNECHSVVMNRFMEVPVERVEDVFRSIKSNASPINGINLSMLEMIFPYINHTVCHIINTSFNSLIMSNIWKRSVVLPLAKLPIATQLDDSNDYTSHYVQAY
ncbi:unnamed protein product [Acanthoscelides obtectus]|uniref:Uncharacterized protein n=1 Tax=Acanthoscelides obtectus TaxID=200917 RepID=A0A9P0LJQ7_ACAOB|nr:unnamed protein product [Acanthoscelides obtectus]CAK1624864.1 hypothetical protein AOBTE_LOCUS2804 [Acanthoscelides obtectus]